MNEWMNEYTYMLKLNTMYLATDERNSLRTSWTPSLVRGSLFWTKARSSRFYPVFLLIQFPKCLAWNARMLGIPIHPLSLRSSAAHCFITTLGPEPCALTARPFPKYPSVSLSASCGRHQDASEHFVLSGGYLLPTSESDLCRFSYF
jgi:hypothetical protein